MRAFAYASVWHSLLTPDIVALLSQIHEYKGEQTLLIAAKGDTLAQLMNLAKLQSTEASNKIDGIFTSDERLKLIVQSKTMPRTRSEQEIAGYRDVLATIHESHDFIPPKPSILLQLHRDLYRYSSTKLGGQYKVSDNVIIEEENAEWHKSAHFQPLPAWETPNAVNALCAAYEKAIAAEQADPLLLIPIFVVDFLCIHPFNDGNGRMSRLLTLLLLYRSGYIVGKYISIEQLLEHSKAAYDESLQESSVGWHEEQNDYGPFVRYMLGIILHAYRVTARVQVLTAKKLSKPKRVREVIKGTPGKITKAELMAQCPDISQVTIQRVLGELLKSGDIIKLSGGRYTAYTWNRERE